MSQFQATWMQPKICEHIEIGHFLFTGNQAGWWRGRSGLLGEAASSPLWAGDGDRGSEAGQRQASAQAGQLRVREHGPGLEQGEQHLLGYFAMFFQADLLYLSVQKQQPNNEDEEFTLSGDSGHSDAEGTDQEFGDGEKKKREREADKLPPLLAKVAFFTLNPKIRVLTAKFR